MTDEKVFIISELKKKGYPLENYVQSMLASRNWHVQPNAYFLDKDTGKGRELDIKATYELFDSNRKLSFSLHLLVQCKKMPGNAWVFFSVPQKNFFYTRVLAATVGTWLGAPGHGVFTMDGTHFDKSEVVATNYCEIITNDKESNKRVNNIWQCVTTLIKAVAQEIEKADADSRMFLDDDMGSVENFNPDKELVYLFYPVIVFEGNMYEAKFSNNDIVLEKIDSVQLFIDYHSGRYKGEFCIDVITKGRFSDYLKDVMKDLEVFEERRIAKSKEYENDLLAAVKAHFKKGSFG